MLDQKYGPLTGREWFDVLGQLHLDDRLIPLSAKLEEHVGITYDVLTSWVAKLELDNQIMVERRQEIDVFGQMKKLSG